MSKIISFLRIIGLFWVDARHDGWLKRKRQEIIYNIGIIRLYFHEYAALTIYAVWKSNTTLLVYCFQRIVDRMNGANLLKLDIIIEIIRWSSVCSSFCSWLSDRPILKVYSFNLAYNLTYVLSWLGGVCKVLGP